MVKQEKLEDTPAYQIYSKVGNFLNEIMKFSGNWQQVHISYQRPGFFGNLGNIIFATLGSCFVIGLPKFYSMMKTFKEYNANGPYYIYAIPFVSVVYMYPIFLIKSFLEMLFGDIQPGSPVDNITGTFVLIGFFTVQIFSKKIFFRKE